MQFLAGRPEGGTLSAIARAAEAPKSSVIGLLAGMVTSGHLTRDDSAVYRLGPNMFSLAAQVIGSMRLPILLMPVLDRLMRETGETALAGYLAPDADVLVYVAKVESTNPVRYTVPVGEHRELYSTAMGKLLLAYMDVPRRRAYLDSHELHAYTQRTITSPARMQKELQHIREQGLSETLDERVVGASALAAPVIGRDGHLLIGLGIAGPTERMRAGRAEHARTLMREAQSLSKLIAHTPQDLREAWRA
jgi:DNA-binding IclR family transcriptional regulator